MKLLKNFNIKSFHMQLNFKINETVMILMSRHALPDNT